MSGSESPRRLVVAAASRHGGTCEIADRIASVLSSRLVLGWDVVRGDVEDPDVFDDADAVVLGSAIYYGHWMRPATKALERLREMPPEHLWLFSTGPVSEVEAENTQIMSADAMADLAEVADEHMVFGGRLDPAQLNRVERLVVKAVHAPPGDHRDWAAVDVWAAHIGTELGASSSPIAGPPSHQERT